MKSIDHNFDISKELGLEDLPNEVWKDIQGYEGLYQVSNLGRIKSLERIRYFGIKSKRIVKDQILKPIKSREGYSRIRLCKNFKVKNFFIHRLVALAFIPNPENKPEIDHINTVRTDNRLENLRWATRSENIRNPISLERNSGVNHYLHGHGERSPFYGKHRSEETKAKIGAKNSKKVINLTTGAIFSSMTKASKFYDLGVTSICNAIKQHTKAANCYWSKYSD